MKHWRDFGEYRATRRPAPEHGIKVKQAGTTWWGQRWIEALQHVLQGDARRLERGRSYARAGRVHDLEVAAGKVSAQVTGTRPEPYQVTMELSQLSAEVWQRAIAAMAAQAQFSAELLAGEMPRAIDEAFHAAGSSLFPAQRAELVTSCSCPDWGDPCKHVAAAHYVLGEAFDRDPFLLFELRGRSRAQVLAALRQARSGALAALDEPAEALEASEVASVQLNPADLAEYERPRAPLPALSFSFDLPASHAALLRQLGAPGSWAGASSPAQAFAPSLQRAAEAARRLALQEPAPPPLETRELESQELETHAPAPEQPAPRRKQQKQAGAKTRAVKKQSSARSEPQRSARKKKRSSRA